MSSAGFVSHLRPFRREKVILLSRWLFRAAFPGSCYLVIRRRHFPTDAALSRPAPGAPPASFAPLDDAKKTPFVFGLGVARDKTAGEATRIKDRDRLWFTGLALWYAGGTVRMGGGKVGEGMRLSWTLWLSGSRVGRTGRAGEKGERDSSIIELGEKGRTEFCIVHGES